jgi:hypothetical protein
VPDPLAGDAAHAAARRHCRQPVHLSGLDQSVLARFPFGQGKIITLPTLLFSKLAGGALDPSAAGIALVAALSGIALLLVSERFFAP